MFLGYSISHEVYRCLASNGRLYIFKDVFFNESRFPYPELFLIHNTFASPYPTFHHVHLVQAVSLLLLLILILQTHPFSHKISLLRILLWPMASVYLIPNPLVPLIHPMTTIFQSNHASLPMSLSTQKTPLLYCNVTHLLPIILHF